MKHEQISTSFKWIRVNEREKYVNHYATSPNHEWKQVQVRAEQQQTFRALLNYLHTPLVSVSSSILQLYYLEIFLHKDIIIYALISLEMRLKSVKLLNYWITFQVDKTTCRLKSLHISHNYNLRFQSHWFIIILWQNICKNNFCKFVK